ncbi:hypothetical protein LPJ66_002059 [Kickxella alabastrina]|uniref:Uncharacterized protein n=1 Tax=Kickxella alabastrina TaxID=61397 RepID=A0ACC1IRU0_9FUNG|nr:hypothetical protein LPJ66_002059 [Kickxella alabastrina]
MIAKQVTEFCKVCFYLSLAPTILAIEGVRWALTFNTETKLAVAATCAPVKSKPASITGTKKTNAERIQQIRRTDAEAVRADAVARIQHLELIIEQSGAVLGVTLAYSNVRIVQLERIVEHSAGVFGQALANTDTKIKQLEQGFEQAAAVIVPALYDDKARIEQLERGTKQSVATNKKARADYNARIATAIKQARHYGAESRAERADHISRIEQLERSAEQAAAATERVCTNYKAAHTTQHSELVKANLDLHCALAVPKSKLDDAEDRLDIQREYFKALCAELCKANGELDVAHTNNEAQQKLATELCNKVHEPAATDSMLYDRHESTDDLDAELCKAECKLDAAHPRLAVSDKRIPQANLGSIKNILHAQRQNAKALAKSHLLAGDALRGDFKTIRTSLAKVAGVSRAKISSDIDPEATLVLMQVIADLLGEPADCDSRTPDS